ncbi:MAG: two-component regulator propeller domain-containing protein, partial [Flavobacteriales bacterium]
FHWSDGYNWFNLPYTSLGGARDITNIVEAPNGKLYVGTWNNGLLELEYDEDLGNYALVKEHNYETSNGNLQTISSDTSDGNYGWLRVKDVVVDDNGLVWITNSLVNKGLAFMNTDGQWQSYNITSYNTQNSHLGDLLIDNQGKKWFFIAKGGGMIVYDDNGTPENTNDDNNKHLNTSSGQGNLPSNTVYSLAIDNDGEVWVGTDKGLAVFYDTDEVFGLNGDAQQVLVEADGYVEPIIANESVTAIAIDGANRKWFGTKNSGVFVYSADGSQQMEHFTQENSPLLSNTINHISIDNNSGEVFISTNKGLISYKGEATAGEKQHGNVLVYPNPVKENYNGPIAIKNVVENANIKITDIKGNLIKTTTAFGGQAIWDGKNKYGERANTGVYLVFSTDPTGLETNVAKILFIK